MFDLKIKTSNVPKLKTNNKPLLKNTSPNFFKKMKPFNVVNTSKASNKNMNWMQTQKKYPKINPFGDADRDGVINMYDCKPFNKKLQEPKLSDEKIKKIALKVAMPVIERKINNANENIRRRENKSKGRAMKEWSEKQKESGDWKYTMPKTYAKEQKRLQTNYVGKKVIVDGKEAEVLGNSFGKVKVRQDDKIMMLYPEKISNKELSSTFPTLSPEDKVVSKGFSDIPKDTPKASAEIPEKIKPIIKEKIIQPTVIVKAKSAKAYEAETSLERQKEKTRQQEIKLKMLEIKEKKKKFDTYDSISDRVTKKFKELSGPDEKEREEIIMEKIKKVEEEIIGKEEIKMERERLNKWREVEKEIERKERKERKMEKEIEREERPSIRERLRKAFRREKDYDYVSPEEKEKTLDFLKETKEVREYKEPKEKEVKEPKESKDISLEEVIEKESTKEDKPSEEKNEQEK